MASCLVVWLFLFLLVMGSFLDLVGAVGAVLSMLPVVGLSLEMFLGLSVEATLLLLSSSVVGAFFEMFLVYQ
jgi:hypothetical protein